MLGSGRVCVIGGNHDHWLEKLATDEVQALMPNSVYLRDRTVEICGLQIHGSPFSRGKSHNAAFQPGNPRNSNTRLGARQPSAPGACIGDGVDSCDILMTHGQPLSSPLIPGGLKRQGENPEDSFPAPTMLHAFGHIHWAYGAAVAADGTVHACASVMADAYRPTNGPIVVDLTSKSTRLHPQ